jgi:hypothetical protein
MKVELLRSDIAIKSLLIFESVTEIQTNLHLAREPDNTTQVSHEDTTSDKSSRCGQRVGLGPTSS